jgi:hypothetical protein
MAKQPKDHVKKHLNKQNVDPATLPDAVIDALNAFEEAELQLVDDLGQALQDAKQLPPDIKICAVH